MLYALTFLGGAICLRLYDCYTDYRRKVRNEAWQSIVSPPRLPLSEVFRLQGLYDTPEC